MREAISDTAGEAYVVTGPTSGIGRRTALELAKHGTVVLVGRDPDRLADTAAWLAREAPGPAVRTVLADLSSLAQVRRAAAEVAALAPSLHILVNNAGVLSPRRTETAEGHELTLAVNHLAPFVLTEALLPALAASGAARVVTVGSSSSDLATIDPDDLELRRGWFMTRAYARSKLASLMTSLAIAPELRKRGVFLNVVHPGVVATDLVRGGGPAQLGWRALSLFALSPRQGAETPLRAALSPTLAGVSGRYLKPRGAATPNRRALDPVLRARVLAATRALL